MHPRALSAGRYAGSFRETNKCVSYAKSPAVWIAGIKLKECKSMDINIARIEKINISMNIVFIATMLSSADP